jgi:hypothetical protein
MKGCWCEMWQIVKLGGHLDAFRRSQLLKTAATMHGNGEGLAKKVFVS